MTANPRPPGRRVGGRGGGFCAAVKPLEGAQKRGIVRRHRPIEQSARETSDASGVEGLRRQVRGHLRAQDSDKGACLCLPHPSTPLVCVSTTPLSLGRCRTRTHATARTRTRGHIHIRTRAHTHTHTHARALTHTHTGTSALSHRSLVYPLGASPLTSTHMASGGWRAWETRSTWLTGAISGWWR